MTIKELAQIIYEIDPHAARYEMIGQKGESYTVFAEYGTVTLMGDNSPAGIAYRVQVDYFTKIEGDPKATAYFKRFANHDEITMDYAVDFESESRYIHHIYDLQVIGDYGEL